MGIQLVKRRGVKGKEEKEETVSERGEGGGRERWMSRKGYWRQIQRDAESRTERQPDRKRSTAEGREGEAEQQCQYLSRSPAGCMLLYQSKFSS